MNRLPNPADWRRLLNQCWMAASEMSAAAVRDRVQRQLARLSDPGLATG